MSRLYHVLPPSREEVPEPLDPAAMSDLLGRLLMAASWARKEGPTLYVGIVRRFHRELFDELRRHDGDLSNLDVEVLETTWNW